MDKVNTARGGDLAKKNSPRGSNGGETGGKKKALLVKVNQSMKYIRQIHRSNAHTHTEREQQRKNRKEEESSASEDESDNEAGSPEDKIDDLIKDLDELEEGETRDVREGESSGDEDGKKFHAKPDEKKREKATDSERSEGEIVHEDLSSESEDGEVGEDGEDGEGGRSQQQTLSRSATEPVLKSKFDSSGSSSEDEETQTKSRNSSFVRKTKSAISGYSDVVWYSEVVSGSDASDDERDNKTPVSGSETRPEGTEGGEDLARERDGEGELEEAAAAVIEEEEEEEDEMSKLPPYLPALMGCRNVEEYEWLNRIEEGTYGVVYRAKNKRTGQRDTGISILKVKIFFVVVILLFVKMRLLL